MFHILPLIALAMTPPVNDSLVPLSPAAVRLHGCLSPRVNANTRRLLAVDLEPLLAGFRHKPGSHPWIGEHIGKWMHAATLAWEYADAETKDQLRKKLDYAAAELIKSQEPDGYLGTYTPDKRFGLFKDADWDVWSHKYCMIGLITYANATGSTEALAAARRAADLLVTTFGTGRKSLITAGTHMGMAATSIIEPMVLLFNATGERKYLDFALHVVKSYDDPNGPRLLESLLSHGSVAKTANAKAYEMLSNCVGLCELYRATADRRFLDAARNAFDDIVASQLYITGTASHHEHFHAGADAPDLPNVMSANVGESCVTVTWIQLCAQLLRITGDPRYADEIERSVYNHLCGAQHPTRADWCYYTALEGTKPYTADTCCCLSSGPRAVAMIPSFVFGIENADTVVINLFEAAAATLTLNGKPVTVRLDTSLFHRAGATLVIETNEPVSFAVKIRVPAWAEPLTTPGIDSVADSQGWRLVPARTWRNADTLLINFAPSPRLVNGTFGNAGKAAVTCGPFVMCHDELNNAGSPPSPLIQLTGEFGPPTGDGLSTIVPARALRSGDSNPITLSMPTFAEAGASGDRFRVWLRAPGALDLSRVSLFCDAVESRSARGNVSGSINDADPGSFVVTFDNSRHAEDWFAVAAPNPVEVRRVVFIHGRTFHDGGWFDTSSSPVRIEYKPHPDAPWQPLGDLATYPRTTSTSAAGLKGGESFELTLEHPVRASAIRAIGTPAHGDNSAQSFASCSELSAFPE